MNTNPVFVTPLSPAPQVHTVSPVYGTTAVNVGAPVQMMQAPSPWPVPVVINSPPHTAIGVAMSPSAAAMPVGNVSPVLPATPGTPGLVYPVSPVSPYQQQGTLPTAHIASHSMYPSYPIGSALPPPRRNLTLVYPAQSPHLPGTVTLIRQPSPLPPPPPQVINQPMNMNFPGKIGLMGYNPSYSTVIHPTGVGSTTLPMQRQPYLVNSSIGMPTSVPVPSQLGQPMTGALPAVSSLPTPSSGFGAFPSQLPLSSYATVGASPIQTSLFSTPPYTTNLSGTMPLTPMR